MKHIRIPRAVVASAFIATMMVFIGCPDDTTGNGGATTTAKYTCENGTPKTGAPSGTANVVACQSCKSGFKLMGTAGVVNTTCVAETDNTAPTFTVDPAVKPGSIGATSVTVTLTASEVGTLFWALYTNGSAVADASALINDATIDTAPNAVVARSATAIAVDTTTDAVEIALTGLSKTTTYTFYAVLQDAAQNISALSPKLDITTVDTVKYTCENGTAKTGAPSGGSDVVACASCMNGFKLAAPSGGVIEDDGTTCVATQYTCPANGTAKTGSPGGTADQVVCERCNTGFKLAAPNGGVIGENGTTCVADGTDSTAPTFTVDPAVKPGSIGATSVTVTLTASEVGTLFWALYTDGSAVADAAALINDATADPKPNTVVSRSATATVVDSTTDAVEIVLTGLTKSTSYDFYAVLQDGAANIGALSPKLEITTTTTKPTFTAGPTLDTITDTSATIKLTASEAGMLFWVLYAENAPAPADARALVKDAMNDNAGEQRSGAEVSVSSNEETVTLTRLNPATSYNFYAVLQRPPSGSIGALSPKLTITTTKTSDLTVTATTATTAPSVAINSKVSLSATVTNEGTAAADPTTLQWYSSTDATIDVGDTKEGNPVVVAALNAGTDSGPLNTTATAPNSVGTVYYGACVAAVATEANTTNNCSSSVEITVTATPEPDLTVAAPTASSATVARRTTFTLSTTVTNSGTGAADATDLKWYSSTDTTIGTDDTLLGSPVTVAALAAGASTASLSSGDIGAPAAPGVYHYGACVVAVTGEADTTNNCSASVTITVPAIYTCPNGTVNTGAPTTGTDDVESCTKCNDSYKLGGTGGDDCVPAVYTCSNGTAKTTTADDKPTGTADVESCTKCDDGYLLGSGTNKPCTPNPNFVLHSNGVTVLCTGAAVGATGDVDINKDGSIDPATERFTKRTVGDTTADITLANAATTCTSGVTNMSRLFQSRTGNDNTAAFNENISHWDTSGVTDMSFMFNGAESFNQDIGSWDVSNVMSMESMFSGVGRLFGLNMKFNKDIDKWDVSQVTNMVSMFRGTSAFDRDIGGWDVSHVTNMESMFRGARAFNQDIGTWDVSQVTDMESMFRGASKFNQDLSGWCVKNLSAPSSFATGATAFTDAAQMPKWGDATVDSCPSS